ncbi:hypothetical protein [Nocardia blacklockiae]|nr:hypothetical protein [Nocardia blacklockiae]MBF6171075.1 hypothetical protein [Nocardia blacklockiae]
MPLQARRRVAGVQGPDAPGLLGSQVIAGWGRAVAQCQLVSFAARQQVRP